MRRLAPGNPPAPARSRWDRGTLLLGLALLAVVTLAYANHFHNGFHFDDVHTVVNNAYIRDTRNIGRFFTDARTFSSLPSNADYRPVVTASLALDYWLGGGLRPFFFHLSTFLWFVVLLLLLYRLLVGVLDAARPKPSNSLVALFATGLYGLHPIAAETVNYVIQRGDLYSTLAIVAGLLIYQRWPDGRRWGVYLLPVAVGSLAKAPAVMFAPLLAAFIFLFEQDASPALWKDTLRRSLPAVVVCGLLLALQRAMTPAAFVRGGPPLGSYLATQPAVILHYAAQFLLPLGLSADTDRQPLMGGLDRTALLGLVFLGGLVLAAWRTARDRVTRPIAFGIVWWLVGLAPTSLVPLAEVENDHRMFLPLVGAVLAATWGAWLLLERRLPRGTLAASAIGLLILCAIGTHRRNIVWRSEESLWCDVTQKSPRNGRGLMNYGLTQMAKGDLPRALDYFERARRFTPDYPFLEINLGIVRGALGADTAAEAHFRRALALAPGQADPLYYYARWLQSKGRLGEASSLLEAAVKASPAWLEPRHLLLQTLSTLGDAARVRRLAQDTLLVVPDDQTAARFLTRPTLFPTDIEEAEADLRQRPTAEGYLNLSLLYHRAGRFQECIAAARSALGIKADYAEAYNNIAAAYAGLGQWEEAIRAAQRALVLRPDFQLARNNLNWAEQEKRQQGRGARAGPDSGK